MTDRRGWTSYLGCLIPLGTALLLLVVLPFGFIGLMLWAADGSWDFEGRSGLRYWVFVKGSRLDRLGLVSPEQTPPPKYSVSLQEGNFPGWRVLSYQSADMPDAIVAIYAKRCREMGLKITKGPEPQAYDGEETGATLVCEIEPYLDAEFHAGRKAGAATTEVGLRIWGSD